MNQSRQSSSARHLRARAVGRHREAAARREHAELEVRREPRGRAVVARPRCAPRRSPPGAVAPAAQAREAGRLAAAQVGRRAGEAERRGVRHLRRPVGREQPAGEDVTLGRDRPVLQDATDGAGVRRVRAARAAIAVGDGVVRHDGQVVVEGELDAVVAEPLAGPSVASAGERLVVAARVHAAGAELAGQPGDLLARRRRGAGTGRRPARAAGRRGRAARRGRTARAAPPDPRRGTRPRRARRRTRPGRPSSSAAASAGWSSRRRSRRSQTSAGGASPPSPRRSAIRRGGEERSGEVLGDERPQVLERLADADQLDRQAQLVRDGDRDAALGGAVELRQRDAR